MNSFCGEGGAWQGLTVCGFQYFRMLHGFWPEEQRSYRRGTLYHVSSLKYPSAYLKISLEEEQFLKMYE